MKQLIVRNLRQRKTASVSMGVTVCVCVMVFVSLFLLYGGMQRGVALNEQRGGADLLVVPADASNWVTDSEFLFSGAPVVSYFDESLADEIAQVEGVQATTVQFYGKTLAESCCTTGEDTRLLGIDFASDWVAKPYCTTQVDGLADDEVIIGCKIDTFTNGTAKILGQEFHVVSTLEETGSSLDFSILMNIDTIRAIAGESEGYEHFWEEYGQPADVVSTVLVDLAPDADPTAVTRKIKKLSGDVTVLARSSVIAESQETLGAVFGIMLGAGLVLALACALQFISRYYSSVWERKAELALYRALGATTGMLRRLICGEAFVVTGAGAVAGTLLGCALYAGGLEALQGVEAFPFSALPIWLGVAGVAGVWLLFALMTFAAIAAPLRQVARINPASAMNQLDIG